MSECPRCHQPVPPQAIACPTCRTPLKAFGHPGIPLHRATEEPLCRTCRYHEDDSCNFPQRPDAWDCTMYSDRAVSLDPVPTYPRSFVWRGWVRRNLGWLALAGLVVLSVVLVLNGS